MFVTPENLDFLRKTNGKVRKTLNKKLPLYKRFIQRYVLYYAGYNNHMPWGIEMDMEVELRGKLTRQEIKEIGDWLSAIALGFCIDNKIIGNTNV